jgi:3-oxoadipate enol-lactonase
VFFAPENNRMSFPSSANNQIADPGGQTSVDVNGARLAYSDAGDGTPVVFLHPTPLDGDYWRPMVAQLKAVRAIIPDLRGHGASELGGSLPVGAFARVPDAPVLTMAQFATDILALLNHLKLESVVFAGCSIGGYVMLELWRRAPERMRGLAFVCSKPQPDAEENLARRAATIARARAGETSAIFDGLAQTLLGGTARQRRPEMVGELRRRMTLTADALVAVQAGLAVRPDSVDTVATINVPVLAVAGGEDPSVSPAEMEAFHAALGGCEFHLLPHAGHFAAFEEPAEVAALFSQWLRSLESA